MNQVSKIQRRRRLLLCLALICLPMVMNAAWAHKVLLGLWPDGSDIEGELGFSNGDMAAPGTLVEVLGPDGEPIGETRVTEEGLFRFTPTRSVPHTFRANLGAGHVAKASLPMDEMPKIRDSGTAAGEAASVESQAVVPVSAERPADAPTLDPTALETLIAEAVRREVKPLRRELSALKEKIGFQQVLGGLGYIAGISGLLFFVYARRS